MWRSPSPTRFGASYITLSRQSGDIWFTSKSWFISWKGGTGPLLVASCREVRAVWRGLAVCVGPFTSLDGVMGLSRSLGRRVLILDVPSRSGGDPFFAQATSKAALPSSMNLCAILALRSVGMPPVLMSCCTRSVYMRVNSSLSGLVLKVLDSSISMKYQ